MIAGLLRWFRGDGDGGLIGPVNLPDSGSALVPTPVFDARAELHKASLARLDEALEAFRTKPSPRTERILRAALARERADAKTA